jgi:hypothetical protein
MQFQSQFVDEADKQQFIMEGMVDRQARIETEYVDFVNKISGFQT